MFTVRSAFRIQGTCRWQTRACHVFAVLLFECVETRPQQLFNVHGAAIMENCPPYNPARRSSLMHSRHPSKSSPAKRDPTRVLTPQYNHAVVPTDAFNTGLLTPQASQNTFDSDAATSLMSPPPEDSARAGFNRQSVRVRTTCLVLINRPILEPALVDQS